MPVIKPNSILIDSSTIDPQTAKWLALSLKEKECLGLDAPVSGGTPGAAAASLTFMVGSNTSQEFDAVSPILKHMGKNIVNCQGNGNVSHYRMQVQMM